MKKPIFLVLAIIFTLFAAVQYNDPDPFLWIVIYMFVAVVCFLAYRNQFPKSVIMVGCFITFGWLLYSIQDGISWYNQGMPNIAQAMKAETPAIEIMRELMGVLLCFSTFLYLYFQANKKS